MGGRWGWDSGRGKDGPDECRKELRGEQGDVGQESRQRRESFEQRGHRHCNRDRAKGQTKSAGARTAWRPLESPPRNEHSLFSGSLTVSTPTPSPSLHPTVTDSFHRLPNSSAMRSLSTLSRFSRSLLSPLLSPPLPQLHSCLFSSCSHTFHSLTEASSEVADRRAVKDVR